jgi:hypothetical protein
MEFFDSGLAKGRHNGDEIGAAKGVAEHHVLIFTVERLPQIVGDRLGAPFDLDFDLDALQFARDFDHRINVRVLRLRNAVGMATEAYRRWMILRKPKLTGIVHQYIKATESFNDRLDRHLCLISLVTSSKRSVTSSGSSGSSSASA